MGKERSGDPSEEGGDYKCQQFRLTGIYAHQVTGNFMLAIWAMTNSCSMVYHLWHSSMKNHRPRR